MKHISSRRHCMIIKKKNFTHLTISIYLVDNGISFLECAFYSNYSMIATNLVCCNFFPSFRKLIHCVNRKRKYLPNKVD